MTNRGYFVVFLMTAFMLSSASSLPAAMDILNTLGAVQSPKPIQPALNSLVSQLSSSILPTNIDLNELVSTLKDTNKNLNQLFKLIDNTNQVFQNLKEYLVPPKQQQQQSPIQYGATGGGGSILTSLRSTFFDKNRQAAFLESLVGDNSHGDIINVNQIVISSNDTFPGLTAPMINVDEMKLIYQLIDMFDMSKLIGNESNRRMMLTLLERFQVPKENLVTIELLANLSKKLNEKKRKTAPETDKSGSALKEVESSQPVDPVEAKTKENAVDQKKPDQDKSMAAVQNRRKELFQRILDLKNRRKMGDAAAVEAKKSAPAEEESELDEKDEESSTSTTATTTAAVSPTAAASSTSAANSVLKRSLRALTGSANENDPLNRFLKYVLSEEVVKEYKWIFDFFTQLQKIKFQ